MTSDTEHDIRYQTQHQIPNITSDTEHDIRYQTQHQIPNITSDTEHCIILSDRIKICNEFILC